MWTHFLFFSCLSSYHVYWKSENKMIRHFLPKALFTTLSFGAVASQALHHWLTNPNSPKSMQMGSGRGTIHVMAMVDMCWHIRGSEGDKRRERERERVRERG